MKITLPDGSVDKKKKKNLLTSTISFKFQLKPLLLILVGLFNCLKPIIRGKRIEN